MATATWAVDAATRALLDELPTLIDEVLERIDAVDTGYDDPAHVDLTAAGRHSVEANLRHALSRLTDPDVTPISAPPEALAEARLCAAAGISLAALLHTYRLGHAATLEVLLGRLDELDLPAPVRRDATTIVTRGSFAYIDAVTPFVIDAYNAERDQLRRSTARRRRQAVIDALNDAPVDPAALGWDLAGLHVGLVVEGPEGEGLLRQLGPVLVVAVSDGLTWGWTRNPPELELPDEHRAGIGQAGIGADGFRRTHRQAVRALRVAELAGLPIARYDAVALEATALAEERHARDFVAEQLGPLADDAPRTVRLRHTLDAYLRARCNAASAAAALGVNDRTVAHRIRAVEELLGHPVPMRATELAVALRWHALFRNPAVAGVPQRAREDSNL